MEVTVKLENEGQEGEERRRRAERLSSILKHDLYESIKQLPFFALVKPGGRSAVEQLLNTSY